MGLLKVLNLCIILGSVVWSNGTDDCTKITTLDDTFRPLPDPPYTLHQGLQQVDLNYKPQPTTQEAWALGFRFYKDGKVVGDIGLGGGGKEGDIVGFDCNGRNTDVLPVQWSSLATSTRHITLQVNKEAMTIYERLDGKKKLIKQHNCSVGVADEVKVQCGYGSCGELHQCAMRATEAPTTPKPPTRPTTPTTFNDHPASKDGNVVWILVSALVAAIIGGVAAVVAVAVYYRRKAEQALRPSQPQGQGQDQGQQAVGDEEGLYLQPRSYPQHHLPTTPTIRRAQAHPAQEEEEHIYDEPFVV